MAMVEVALAILAAWRLAHDLAVEHGPFGVFYRLRRFVQRWAETRIDNSEVEEIEDHWAYSIYVGIGCPHCLSFWSALAVALLILAPGGRLVILWLGVAGAVGLINKVVDKWLQSPN